MAIGDREKTGILVADDDRIVKLVWENLANSKYRLKFANNGQQVLKINLQDIDIIFMDINMPELSGIEVTKIIRKGDYKQNIPIIGVTAHVSSDIIDKCLAAGMNEVLNKPLFPYDVDAVMSRWLE